MKWGEAWERILLGHSHISLRDFIVAVGSADEAHGVVSTAAVAGALGSSLLLMVAALPQTTVELRYGSDEADRNGDCARPTCNNS